MDSWQQAAWNCGNTSDSILHDLGRAFLRQWAWYFRLSGATGWCLVIWELRCDDLRVILASMRMTLDYQVSQNVWCLVIWKLKRDDLRVNLCIGRPAEQELPLHHEWCGHSSTLEYISQQRIGKLLLRSINYAAVVAQQRMFLQYDLAMEMDGT